MNQTLSKESESLSPPLLNVALSRIISFGILTALVFPWAAFSCLVIYWTIRMPELRGRIKNHLILCVFFITFIQVPIILVLTYLIHYEVFRELVKCHLHSSFIITAG